MIPLGVVQQQTIIPPVPPAWAPTDLTGLLHWVEPDAISNFYQDAARTTAVTAVDDPVGSWTDKSGNNLHFKMSTLSIRPAYKGNHVQGDGADYIESPDWTFTDPAELMWGFKFKHTDTTATRGIFQFATAASSGNPKFLIQTNNTQLRFYFNSNYWVTIPITVGEEYTLVLRITKSGSAHLLDYWVNGVKQTQYIMGTGFHNSSSRTYLMNGYAGSSSNPFYGYVCAEGNFSDEEALELSNYIETMGTISAPTDISGCVVWYDANDPGNAPTTQWDDKSGNDLHATVPAGGVMPIFSNGEAVFDGSSGTRISIPYGTLTAAEVFIKQRKNASGSSTGTDSGWLAMGGGSGGGDHYPYGGVIYTSLGRTNRLSCGAPVVTITNSHVVDVISTSSKWEMYLDGNTQHTNSASFSMGGSSGIFGQSNNGYHFYGYVEAIIIYNRELDSHEREQVLDYLNNYAVE